MKKFGPLLSAMVCLYVWFSEVFFVFFSTKTLAGVGMGENGDSENVVEMIFGKRTPFAKSYLFHAYRRKGGLASGRDLIVWRLARSGAQYCAPKATLEDHIALEMEPSGLNAPRTSHSECHTFRAPLSGFPCIMCIPLNATNT